MPRRPRHPVGLALAGGGPLGAIYEIGVLAALEESIEGLDLNALDCYVGVSAGSFLAAALANGIPIAEIHRLFILGGEGEGALAPDLFMQPAMREYGMRARALPRVLAAAAWRHVARPFSSDVRESIASLGCAIPTGVFDNEAIHEYLLGMFSRPGRSNDFRRLRRRLYLVATDLDTGRSVSFGRPGHDHVPISKAVQASAALPGLFPPVRIDARDYVDGALRKTLHASEALDDGMRLVLCVNPIVPFDASLAAGGVEARRDRLADGGLPVVLSQTFRAVIHSRMAVGLSKYAARYRGRDVLLFQPRPDDGQVFFAGVFRYATREKVCQHAYERTREDLLARAGELAPAFERHGMRLREEVLLSAPRRLGAALPRTGRARRLPEATGALAQALGDLDRWLRHEEARRGA